LAINARPIHSFTTAQKIARPMTPTREQGCKAFDKKYISGECHPWDLVFEWEKARGAKDYQFEVAADQDIANAIPNVTGDCAFENDTISGFRVSCLNDSSAEILPLEIE
jgi:hypothetical protein